MKAPTATLSLLAALAFCPASWAQDPPSEAFTDPVGFVAVTAKGNSDTRFAVPLSRGSVFTGVIASVSGSDVTVQGTPGWDLNQFVYAAGIQPNRYYVEFQTDGSPLEGKRYDVASNAAGATLTLTLGTDTLGSAAGEVISIIPHWTFATLFPNQAGISGTTSISGAGSATKILIPDTASTGINLVNSATYYYFTGATNGGPGWRRSGGGFANIKNDDIIKPSDYLVIRQDGVGDTVLAGTGAVPMSKRMIVIGTKAASTAQDNFVELDIPVPVSLTDSGLFESGAFASTTSISGASGDKLLVYDDSVALINKVPTKTYYYFSGATNGGPGWRRQGGGFSNIVNSEIAFQPGSGVIIRKQGVVTPSTLVWSPLPSYLSP